MLQNRCGRNNWKVSTECQLFHDLNSGLHIVCSIPFYHYLYLYFMSTLKLAGKFNLYIEIHYLMVTYVVELGKWNDLWSLFKSAFHYEVDFWLKSFSTLMDRFPVKGNGWIRGRFVCVNVDMSNWNSYLGMLGIFSKILFEKRRLRWWRVN